jgi:hypothetical protein
MKYVIRMFQENQTAPILKGTHQLLIYTGDVILLGGNIDTTNKPTETNLW